MKRSSRADARKGRAFVLAMVIGGATACGGVTKFNDTTPISIKGPAPEAPPEPPPPPPAKKKRVEVKVDRIDITEKIQFELNQATIKPESDDLLDEIVTVLTENPQIKKVDIVGHTSDEGSDTYNQTLSENRAKAVLDHLVAHGIDAGRLTSKGMGEAVPIGDNKTEEGRELNRRVEFLILEQGDPAADKKGDKKDKAEKKKKTEGEEAVEKKDKAGKKAEDGDKAEKKQKAETDGKVEKKEKKAADAKGEKP